jgi:hypothetical protein
MVNIYAAPRARAAESKHCARVRSMQLGTHRVQYVLVLLSPSTSQRTAPGDLSQTMLLPIALALASAGSALASSSAYLGVAPVQPHAKQVNATTVVRTSTANLSAPVLSVTRIPLANVGTGAKVAALTFSFNNLFNTSTEPVEIEQSSLNLWSGTWDPSPLAAPLNGEFEPIKAGKVPCKPLNLLCRRLAGRLSIRRSGRLTSLCWLVYHRRIQSYRQSTRSRGAQPHQWIVCRAPKGMRRRLWQLQPRLHWLRLRHGRCWRSTGDGH